MNRLSYQLAILLFSVTTLFSCKKGKDVEPVTPVEPSKKTGWQVVNNATLANQQGLLSVYTNNERNVETYFYGKFDGQGAPDSIQEAVIRRIGSDSSILVRYDKKLRVQSLLTEVRGTLNNLVFQFNYDTASKPKINTYFVDWSKDSSTFVSTSILAYAPDSSIRFIGETLKTARTTDSRIGQFMDALINTVGPVGAVVLTAFALTAGTVLAVFLLGFSATAAVLAGVVAFGVFTYQTASADEVEYIPVQPQSPGSPSTLIPNNSYAYNHIFEKQPLSMNLQQSGTYSTSIHYSTMYSCIDGKIIPGRQDWQEWLNIRLISLNPIRFSYHYNQYYSDSVKSKTLNYNADCIAFEVNDNNELKTSVNDYTAFGVHNFSIGCQFGYSFSMSLQINNRKGNTYYGVLKITSYSTCHQTDTVRTIPIQFNVD